MPCVHYTTLIVASLHSVWLYVDYFMCVYLTQTLIRHLIIAHNHNRTYFDFDHFSLQFFTRTHMHTVCVERQEST